MNPQSLIQISCEYKESVIGITNYADMIVLDRENTIVAIRFGGYPETVLAMSDAIISGCSLKMFYQHEQIEIQSLQTKNYERKITRDGVYAESIYYRKDDTLQSLCVGLNKEDDKENDDETIDIKRNLYFFCENDDDLFDELDRKLAVPLIWDFQDYFISELKTRGLLQEMRVFCLWKEFRGYYMSVSSDEMEIAQILEDGLKNGDISIPKARNHNPVWEQITSFTKYLKIFGDQIVNRIKESFPPVYNPEEEPVCKELEEVNQFIIDHAGYSLFDAQLRAAEALKRCMEKDKLAFLVAECGTGKTKIGSAAIYAYQHSGLRRQRKNFNVVICPSHITGKWVRELHESIPNCFAQHVSSISDVDQLYRFYQSHDTTVYCILSKETARNGYMRQPVVRWNERRHSFVCPNCGNAIDFMVNEKILTDDCLDALAFRNENSRNHLCPNCGDPLWEALNPSDIRYEWVRIGGFGFVHRRFLGLGLAVSVNKEHSEKIKEVIQNPDGVFPVVGAYRRYPLSSYIKKKFHKIDALLIDELHQYSGESAQGQAMAELAGISKKVIGMTATLVNGYAKGMFYLLWRLKADLMILDNQRYDNSKAFCQQYGVIEEMYEVDLSNYNASSKATKRKIREKFLPGISPIVYSRFLMENAVFLSLTDMGKELPDYEEIPLPYRMRDDVLQEYRRIEQEYKSIMAKMPEIGNLITSSCMNLLSVYPDQPYDQKAIYVPLRKQKQGWDNEPLIVPQNIGNSSVFQPKDEDVIQLVERKIGEGGRVIIYTAWTRLDTQHKIQKWLIQKKIPTAILDKKIPTTKREAWVDKRVREGIKVLIVNPAIVETGLDLNAFTTLIFYNIAFNLYVFRQASRRSWRINQTATKVEVYMTYYADTIQQSALRLMASKLSAATVIEGNISEEGLAALSDCNDLTTQLAKELMKGVKENVTDLADSFKKMALIGNQKPMNSVQKAKQSSNQKQEPPKIFSPVTTQKSKKQIWSPKEIGQLDIFDLLAS